MANLFQSDDLQQLEADQVLARYGMFVFSKLKEASSWQPLHLLQAVVKELDWRGAQVLDEARKRQASDMDSLSPAPVNDDEIAAVSVMAELDMLQGVPGNHWSLDM